MLMRPPPRRTESSDTVPIDVAELALRLAESAILPEPETLLECPACLGGPGAGDCKVCGGIGVCDADTRRRWLVEHERNPLTSCPSCKGVGTLLVERSGLKAVASCSFCGRSGQVRRSIAEAWVRTR